MSRYLTGAVRGLWLVLCATQVACVSTVEYEKRIWDQANAAQQEKNYRTAFSFYQQAAELGVVEAQYNVAQMYQQGVGVEPNVEMARWWYSQAAEARLPQAQYQLAKLYQQDASPKSQGVAWTWLQRAAESGDAQAQLEVAQAYHAGILTEKDLVAAQKWYLRAAEQNISEAQFQAATMLEPDTGMAAGTKANRLFRSAAKEGHLLAKAKLGIYEISQAETDDVSEAFELLKQAAVEGHAESQYQLSLLYLRGRGVERNLAYASHWLKQAAEQGWREAQYDLGVHYMRGVGVTQNPVRAYEWFEKAAAQDHSAAKGFLATLSSSLIFAVVANNEEEQLNRLLTNGADVNVVGDAGFTPLHYAVNAQHASMVRTLLARGAKINTKSDDGFTPLFIAVTRANMEIAGILISNGADVNIRDNKGVAVLDYAMSGGSEVLVRLLAANGARSNQYSEN
ncbi:MAG: ankyrin repeat domain-containing protein [Gammaproteobacteria bacterium]|nr:ankyrin repeat domain-containing protein [Gammaproteobacteria bacterium]